MHNKTSEIIVFGYLLLAFCIPSSLGLYRISSNTDSGVKAASWDVSLDQIGNNNSISITPSGSGTYTFKVVSDSDVDTIYSIIVSNVPSDVEVKLDTGPFKPPTNNTVTFPDVKTILYSDEEKEIEHTLTFRASSGAALVNNQTISINVDFRQAM